MELLERDGELWRIVQQRAQPVWAIGLLTRVNGMPGTLGRMDNCTNVRQQTPGLFTILHMSTLTLFSLVARFNLLRISGL